MRKRNYYLGAINQNRAVRAFVRMALFFLFVACGTGIRPNLAEAPTINGVSTSPNADGTVTVTISGSGFVDGSTVLINSVTCSNVHVISPAQLTCILPNGTIALVNIVITTPSGGSSGSGGGGSGGGSAFHTIFATKTQYKGNLGGLTGADSLCQTAGSSGTKTSSLTGTWRAILSSTTVNAKDRVTFVLGSSIKNTNGDTIVSLATSLWGGTLMNAVRYDENGNATSSNVYTGSNSNGTSSSIALANTCSDWTLSGTNPTGSEGDANSTSTTWLQNNSVADCDTAIHRLYCINSNN